MITNIELSADKDPASLRTPELMRILIIRANCVAASKIVSSFVAS